MERCPFCQSVDVRALLRTSEAQKLRETADNAGLRNYRDPLPFFHRLHPSLRALARSAGGSCRLCRVLWDASRKTLGIGNDAPESLLDAFPGDLFLGASGWKIDRQGFPYVTLTQIVPSGGERRLCFLEPFIERGGPETDVDHLVGRAVYRDSASLGCLEVAATWLSTCIKEHHTCSPESSEPPILPTRVIDVGSDSIPPRLIITNGRRGTYVALSYCWGGNSDFVLNVEKMPSFLSGVPLEDFPKTLRDAVVVTRSFKIQYIWIDALCIQQDSPEDWAREAATMKDVYAHSALTLSAARASATTTGIFSERKGTQQDCWVDLRSSGASTTKLYLRSGSDLWDDTLKSSPLSKRGWTLQEGLLAPRTLSYGSQQMIWECSTHQIDEGGRVAGPSQDYKDKEFMQMVLRSTTTTKAATILGNLEGRLPSRLQKMIHQQYVVKGQAGILDPFDRWYDIVQDFTSRSLTYQSDALPALCGIAQAFSSILPTPAGSRQYVAGIWTSDIHIGLLWQRQPIPSTRPGQASYTSCSSDYIGPSWSWAGVRGGMVLSPGARTREALRQKQYKEKAKVLSIEVELQSDNSFGRLLAGALNIRGRFKELARCPRLLAKACVTPSPPPEAGHDPLERHLDAAFATPSAATCEFLQKHREVPGQKFAVLEIIRWTKSPSVWKYEQEPGVEMLLLETTGTGGDWRRMAFVGIRRRKVPAVGSSVYDSVMAWNETYDAIVQGDWKRRDVRIV